jgi:uncharacterized protein with NRDE domain
MCLAALSIDPGHRFALVVAANRDEFYDRPSSGLDWWAPQDHAQPILAGRDLQGGGTWLGLSPRGRFALLTNVRSPGTRNDAAPSRGGIVPLWLRGDLDAGAFWSSVSGAGHNPFNVLMGDMTGGACFWAASGMDAPRALGSGLFGLSNAALDTPWPKVTALKARMAGALASAATTQDLAERLFEGLADPTLVADALLPSTGVPLDWERALSPAFIRAADRRYGTRCSTVLVVERSGDGHVAHVMERSFSSDALLEQRRAELPGWPLRHAFEHDTPAPVAVQSARTISTWGMPASSNAGPRSTKPARA